MILYQDCAELMLMTDVGDKWKMLATDFTFLVINSLHKRQIHSIVTKFQSPIS